MRAADVDHADVVLLGSELGEGEEEDADRGFLLQTILVCTLLPALHVERRMDLQQLDAVSAS